MNLSMRLEPARETPDCRGAGHRIIACASASAMTPERRPSRGLTQLTIGGSAGHALGKKLDKRFHLIRLQLELAMIARNRVPDRNDEPLTRS